MSIIRIERNSKAGNTHSLRASYRDNLEYLSDLFDYLTSLAKKRILVNKIDIKGSSLKGKWVGMLTAGTDVDLDSEESLKGELRHIEREIKKKYETLQSRTNITNAKHPDLIPLEKLSCENNLSEFEKFVLALVLGPNIDSHFGLILEAVTGSRGSSEIRTVLDVLCNSVEEKVRARKYFVNTGKLLSNGLITISSFRGQESENSFMRTDIELSRRVASFLLGEYDVDDQLARYSAVIDPEVDIAQVVLPKGVKENILELIANRERFLSVRKSWGFDQILSYGKGTIMLFSGPSGTGKTMLAHALAKATHHRLMLVDIRKIAEYSGSDFEDNLERIFHEAHLQHAILFFDEADEMFTDRCFNSAMPTILRKFECLDGIAILATNRKQILDEAMERRILYKLDFELPVPELREEIWRKHLPPAAPLSDDIDIKVLAEEFEFTGGFIKNAVLIAMNRAIQRPLAEQKITQNDLWSGAAVQRRNILENTTDKLIPKVGLRDVILPDDVKEQVENIVAAARRKSLVFTAWGFNKKLSYGKALTALFSGESGIGKTLTAEAIAFELGQPLYPVNLSGVISKYVGETEKNIRQVFQGGKEAQAILFFDEADALFGTRLDEGSSHATYINQQINVLLTEIEKYDGIVILATNRPEAMDPAFQRRLRYRVAFPKPGVNEREKIWQTILPPEAPIGEIDFHKLAEDFPVTGGAIKNIILRAAFVAATDGKVITETILRRSAEEECPRPKEEKIGFHRS